MGPVPQPEEERDRPGPHNTEDIEDAEFPDVIVNAGSDIDDDDDNNDDFDGHGGYGGYQALPQNVDEHHFDTDSESNEEPPEFEAFQQYESMESSVERLSVAGAIDVHEPVVDIREPEKDTLEPATENIKEPASTVDQVPEIPLPEKKELQLNQPRNCDHQFDDGHADKIKSVMSGIRLPSTNIPDWAQNLSDDQWQSQIVNKLVNPSTNPTKDVHEKQQRSEAVTQPLSTISPVSKDCEEPS